MKRKNLVCGLSLAMLFLSQATFAQKNILVGFQGGASVTDLSSGSGGSNSTSTGWSSKLGSDFGLLINKKIKGNFSVQLEINYASQGAKKDGVQPVPTNPYLTTTPAAGLPAIVYANLNTVTKINYVQIPILAKYSFPLGSGLHFFIDAGPYIGLMSVAKTVSNGLTGFYSDAQESNSVTNGQEYTVAVNQDIRSQIRHIDAGLQGNIGLQKKLFAGYIFLSAGGNYGFIPVEKQSSNGKNNTIAGTLQIGYLFKL